MSERRIPSLDGLRAISIFLVMISHMAKWKHISLAAMEEYGTTGVFIFFVLSGYLITGLLLREHEKTSTVNLWNFYLRRGFRIFPAAFVFMAIVTTLYWRQMHWYHVLAAVLYVANMDATRPWIFSHLWSLGIEEQFYLLWPFAIKKWFRHRTIILLCVFLAAPLLQTALYAFRVHNGVRGSLPVFASQLAIGCLLAILAPRLPRINGFLAMAMVGAILLVPFFPANTPAKTLFLLFILSPIVQVSIAGVVLHVVQVPYKALNWLPIVWLGRISYSLYLWQQLFCSNPSLHFGFILALPALGCACISYYFVEQPMLRLREKLGRKRYGKAITTPHGASPTSLESDAALSADAS